MARRIHDVDWARWRPEQRATLLFVIRDGSILLIHKKRGLGAGKVNGPGGRIEPGETALQCAVRETREELRIVPTGVRECGELRFQFTDGLSIHGVVFAADGFEGRPQETEEARPFWSSLDAIPFERMWADDVLWFPHLLGGRRFSGRFLFEGDTLLDYELQASAASSGMDSKLG